jgi:O-antigen/teichoic acid export membrane protein
MSYSLATAINRGLVFLALPFLGKSLSIEDFGLWTLSQIIVSLGAPLFSLNGASGILREGVGNRNLGFAIFNRFVQITLKISLAVVVLSVFLPKNWIFYTLFLVLIEAFASLITIWYRSQDRHILYFTAVFTKLFALACTIVITGNDSALLDILFYQAIFGAVFLLPFFIHTYFQEKVIKVEYDFQKVLIFCLALLPHGFSQWIISSSDRIIIKSSLGDSSLGHYSLAYTLAMSIMLINSGLGMTVGVDVIRDYSLWQNTSRRSKAILFYSLLFLSASIGLVLIVTHFKDQLPFLRNLTKETVKLLPLILNGMYFMGIYLFYINYLNYLRKSVLLSSITIGTAILNVLLTLILIQFFDVEGAAISALFSYFFIMIASMWFAVKKASLPRRYYIIDIGLICITTAVNLFTLQFIISG